MAMTITNRTLIDSQYVSAAASVAYTSSGARTTITQFTVYNNGATANTLTVWLVPSGGARDNSNVVFKGAIGGEESRQIVQVLNRTLESGATIDWLSSAATTLAGSASGFIQT
jgi:hypothetical protein